MAKTSKDNMVAVSPIMPVGKNMMQNKQGSVGDPYQHHTYGYVDAPANGGIPQGSTNEKGGLITNGIGMVDRPRRDDGTTFVPGIGTLGRTLNSPEIVAGYERNAGGPPRRLTTEDRRNLYSESGIAMQTPAVYVYGFATDIIDVNFKSVIGLGTRTTSVFDSRGNSGALLDTFLFMDVGTNGNSEWRRIEEISNHSPGEERMLSAYSDYRSAAQNVTDVLRNNGTNIGLPLVGPKFYFVRNSARNAPYIRTPIVASGFNFIGNKFMLVKRNGGNVFITPFSVGIQTQDDVAINIAGMREYLGNFTRDRVIDESLNDINAVDAVEQASGKTPHPVQSWVKETGFQAPSAYTKGSKGILGNCSPVGEIVTGIVVGGAIFALYKTCRKQ